MNKVTETSLQESLKSGISDSFSIFKNELQNIYEVQIDQQLKNWCSTVQDGDSISLKEFYKKYQQNYEILYFTQKYIRRNYKDLWPYIKNGEFIIKKMFSYELLDIQNNYNLEAELISNLLGFTKVFKLLTSLKKPLIGHNLFLDLLVMYESFEEPLPYSYHKFKQNINQLFPVIFDTRVVAYYIEKRNIPKDKKWGDKGLESIFEYFKTGTGRHLALNSPAIQEAEYSSSGNFHEAGWDSFCTGYIFIRMAYLDIYKKYPKSKSFVTSELIAGFSHLKNQLNVIRGFNSTIVSIMKLLVDICKAFTSSK